MINEIKSSHRNRFVKNIVSLLLILVLVMGLTGCSNNSVIDHKKELNIQITTFPATIDPQCVSDTVSSFVTGFFINGLYEYTADYRLVPGLAESKELSEDNLTVTFHLKDDIYFSNGSPITSEDFVYAFQRIADPDVGSNALYFITDCCKVKNADEVSTGKLPLSELGVSAPDKNTFVLELIESCPYLDSLLTFPVFAPCSRSFVNSCGNEYATSPETMLYSGPFMLDRFEPLATQIHLVPNPYYHNKERSSLPGVNLQVVTDSQQAAMCFKTGLLDIINVTGEITDIALGDPRLTNFPSAAFQYINFNQKECPALTNRNIRMALSKSIDRDSIAKNVLRLGYATLNRANPPGYFFEVDGTDFSKDTEYYYEYIGYDTGAAKTIWQQGLNELGVSSIELSLYYNATMGNLAEAIKAQLEKNLSGLTVKLNPLTRKEYLSMSSSGTGFDLFLGGWFGDYEDPTTFFNLYLSTGGKKVYNNPEYDRLMAESGSIESVKNPANRNKLLHQAEDILMEDVGMIPLFFIESNYLIRDGVTNFLMTATSTIVPAYIEKEVVD